MKAKKELDYSIIEDTDKGIKTLIIDDNKNKLSLNITKKDTVDFYFCCKGSISYKYDNIKYDLDEDKTAMIYSSGSNTKRLIAEEGSRIIAVMIELGALHKIFTKNELSSSMSNYFKKKHKLSNNSIPINNILNQIFRSNLSHNYRDVYFNIKSIELLLHYFSDFDYNNYYNEHNKCPFLVEPEITKKVIKAKEEMLLDLSCHKTIEDLSKKVGLSPTDLKSNFKRIYKDTIYSYFKKKRIKHAYDMIESNNNIRVKELSYTLGYLNPSHFIGEFKKIYGITPKQLKKILQIRN